MTTQQRPVIFLVHGAWHQPSHYEKLLDVLKAQGWEVAAFKGRSSLVLSPGETITPQSPEVSITLEDDAASHKQHLIPLIEAGRDVFVVGHSYGGAVTSQMVTEDLSSRSRQAKGMPGGVVGLFYLAAFFVMKGERPGSWQPTWDLTIELPFAIPNEGTGLLDCFNPDVWFYHDVEPEERQRCIVKMLPHPLSVTSRALTNSAPEHAPTTYLFCSRDRAIRIDVQQSMVRKFEEAGHIIRKRECDAGHSPFLDRPEYVAEEISMAVQWSLSQLE